MDPLEHFDKFVDEVVRRSQLATANSDAPPGQQVDPAQIPDWLSIEDLKTHLKLAGRQLIENSALKMGTDVTDALALTLLSIYDNGVYGGSFVSKPLDQVAQLLLKARKHATPEGEPEVAPVDKG